MVQGFVETGGPVVGWSISIRLVLPKSVGELEMMPVNLLVSIVSSLHCMSNGTSESCICIGTLLLLCACVVKLEPFGKLEVGALKAGACYAPCHYDVTVSICSVHLLHFLLW